MSNGNRRLGLGSLRAPVVGQLLFSGYEWLIFAAVLVTALPAGYGLYGGHLSL
ncbi:hypothetical protein ACNFCJ_13685 [Pseudomonas sp. NY15364]|uniref:hypothetical protein n=1 Tax=Pseudomonas sp. NY15364 TaxID=3400353 RepID=UPI003A862FAA